MFGRRLVLNTPWFPERVPYPDTVGSSLEEERVGGGGEVGGGIGLRVPPLPV